MTLSIFTTVTDPKERGDNPKPSLKCYADLADELVIVNGGKTPWHGDVTVNSGWPQEFSWPLIGQQFQMGYEAATGDWVIHADLDYLFHQKDFSKIREAMGKYPDAPAIVFYKWQFILPDRYNLKSRLPIMVNKKVYGDRIKFDGGGDLCQPTLDGQLMNIDKLPVADVPVYNYEKLTKTKEQIMNDVGRMERAYERYFGKTQYGSNGTDKHAYKLWVDAQKGKFNKPQKIIALSRHPIYIQQTIKNLRKDQWGHSGLGNLERNIYV